MRILAVRLKNLNSLSGEWSIDFTHPSFATAGIFAITGPTGAGKSTILDAIGLALYGRTPRLGKISKGSNEIMSRRTGECFAEVSFVSQKGHYRCHWSQHRARRQADGELQMPRHEICDARSGEILASSVRGVAEEIEAATGMDFDRFTRSMLLAQGGFAAFLHAAPDERAPVLEQITGTEIYSRISMRVHELRSSERQLLHNLQAELAGMHMLTDEEEQSLCQRLALQEEAATVLAERLLQGRQLITWRETVHRLEEEVRQLREGRVQVQTRLQDFAPQQERLELAMRALELAGSHASLSALRRSQESDMQALSICEQNLPEKQALAEQVQTLYDTAIARLQTRKEEQEQAQPLLQEVRALDVRLAASSGPINSVMQAKAALAVKMDALAKAHAQDRAELAQQEEKQALLQNYFADHAADARLIEELAALRSRFAAVQAQEVQLLADEKAAQKNQILWRQAGKGWQAALTRQQELAQQRETGLAQMQELQAIYLSVLAGQDLAFWRRQHQCFASQRELLLRAQADAGQMLRVQVMQQEMAGRAAVVQQEQATLAKTLVQACEQVAGLARERDLLETQLSLLQRIEALEDVRQQLQDGEPCPLCGALAHPFASGNVPVADASRERLSQVRAAFSKLEQQVSEIRSKATWCELELEQLQARQQEQHEQENEACGKLAAIRQQLPQGLQWLEKAGEIAPAITSLLQQIEIELGRSAIVVQQAEAHWRSLQIQQEALNAVNDAAMAAEREAVQQRHHQQNLAERLQTQQEALAQQRSRQATALAILEQDLQAYRPACLQSGQTLAVAMLDNIAQTLQRRLQQWRERQTEQEACTLATARLEEQIRQQEAQLKHLQHELDQQQHHLDQLVQARDALAQARRELFAEKVAQSEEDRLRAAVRLAEKELEAARNHWQQTSQECERLQTRAAELGHAINARLAALAEEEAAFCHSLQQAGFADEATCLSASLPEEERRQLAQQSEQLRLEQVELERRLAEQSAHLEQESRRQLSPLSLEDLRKEQDTAQGKEKQLQQELGAIRQRLTDNDQIKTRQQERIKAIAAQERVLREWDMLHELIGSGDGKKYRNFAQSLTFELVISHANRQLQKMSDRYLLIHDPKQPLTLNVIDNYQAGEIRSTKNLSGGESFIVSLALALGLSSMSSRKVRVDSLFLDEGFGSLDEDSLDVALETLAGLRQEGKLIGVISHVQVLHERIPTRIRVEPLTSGNSRISGPGCLQL